MSEPQTPPLHTVTVEKLAVRCGVKPASADYPEVEDTLAGATALLAEALLRARKPMPQELANVCVLRIGRALWDTRRQQGPSAGIGQAGGIPPARDPLASSWPILGHYVAAGLA